MLVVRYFILHFMKLLKINVKWSRTVSSQGCIYKKFHQDVNIVKLDLFVLHVGYSVLTINI